jgi:predicted dienelactone hydrolase
MRLSTTLLAQPLKTGMAVLLARPVLATFMLSLGLATPSLAAERLKVRVGFFEQSIEIADLEKFVKTGRLSPTLQPLAPFLTSDVRQILSRQLSLPSGVEENLTDQVVRSKRVQPWLRALSDVMPNTNQQRLRATLSKVIRRADGVSIIGFLKAYPAETIHVDATTAIALLSKLNPSFWQTQVLRPSLEEKLGAIGTPPKTTIDPTQTGSVAVQTQTLSLYDRNRRRSIPVDLYIPSVSRSPLVVISHGFGSDRAFLGYLAKHLASHGFAVAVPEHPGSNLTWLKGVSQTVNPSAVLPPAELIDRPQDIRFVLDELAQLNRQPGRWQGQLPTDRVSLIGHSLGGTTALMLAGATLDWKGLEQFCRNRNPLGRSPADWLQCAIAQLLDTTQTKGRLGRSPQLQWRDPRVVQTIALNPLTGQLFGQSGLTQVATPTLILASTEDVLTPALSQQFRPFNQLPDPKYLITAIGGTHLSVGDPQLEQVVAQTKLARERQGAEMEPLRKLIRGVSLAFIQQLTPAAKTYEPFLTPSYAQSLSTPDLPLRFSTRLPADLVK